MAYFINRHIFLYITFFSFVLLTSCSKSVTNVYDYYIQNNIVSHESGNIVTSKTKLLYRMQESVNKAQLELIAFKSDTMKCLVVGSHKVAKAFNLFDSTYYFDVNDLYSNVRGNDFIRQLGDLSIYFTNISLSNCNTFLKSVDKLKAEFNKAAPSENTHSHIDFSIQSDVFVSIEKKYYSQTLESAATTIWVGKRKHEIRFEDLIKAMQELKSFN